MIDAHVSLVIPRLDEKPWGGRKLGRYGLDLPPDAPIGEALVTAGEAVVASGDSAGQTLQAIIDVDPEGRLGTRAHKAVSGKTIFPLLAKLIDAAENLSIQVHPDDEGARSLDRLGKTEAWHVLDAAPGAKLYLGLKDDVTLDTFMEHARKLDGTSAADLRAVEARAGETIIIPAGTVHALGAGVMVYEIQQSSDVTFRLDDWGRVDAQGNPREMHLEQGEAATRVDLRPEAIVPVRLDETRTLLTACRYFALEKLDMDAGVTLPVGSEGSPEVLTLLSGSIIMQTPQETIHLTPGASGVVWPASESATVSAGEPSVVLRAWVPDLHADVIEPARAAGASDDEISALGGMTSDLRDALGEDSA